MYKNISRPTELELFNLGEQLKNHHSSIIKIDDRLWKLKVDRPEDQRKREKLAYTLGSLWLNIAPVEYLTKEDLEKIKSLGINTGNALNSVNIYVVRLVESFAKEEINIKNLTEAAAGELAFSLWIRRRDAHVNNRSYIGGVPMFFDHHIAFLAEKNQDKEVLRTEDDFYTQEPRNWRIRITQDDITTAEARILQNNEQYIHFIHNIEDYKQALQDITKKIQLDNRDYLTIALEVGFMPEEATRIKEFLHESKNNINIQRLIDTTTKENYD